MKYIKIKCYTSDDNEYDCVINIKRIDCIAHHIDDDGEERITIFLSGSDRPLVAKGYTLESILYLIEIA